MNILFYGKAKSKTSEKILLAMNEQISQLKVECYNTIETFTDRMRQYLIRPAIAVLLISNRKELLKFIAIKELLRDIQIILILLNNDKDIVGMGHQLYPRFVSYSENDFRDVTAVMEKMTHSHNMSIEKQLKSAAPIIANQKVDS